MAYSNINLIEDTTAKEGPTSHFSASSWPQFTRNEKEPCSSCYVELETPYIKCVVCDISICTNCFSKGVEFAQHKNNHDYQVYKEDFVLFDESDWTAKEEILLLDSILRHGNWNSVAKEFPKRSKSEIMQHYEYFYLDRRGCGTLPSIPASKAAVFPTPVIPYSFKISDMEEPPRYSPNTVGYTSLAGYNPARSDFECEYDANAEDLIANLKPVKEIDPYYDVMANLQCAIIQCYNRRLKERQRWKKILRDHGLILTRKLIAWLGRYDMTITRPVCNKLLRFMQHCRAERFEFLMEGLHRAGELKIQIMRLCNYRSKGLKTLDSARLYVQLNQQKEQFKKDIVAFQRNPKYNWKLHSNPHFTAPTGRRRSVFTPLDILGLPGYEKLSDKERDLCTNVRLVPQSYFELKTMLIAENKKLGHIKLQTARKLLKIDVNKTRKLYDFLVQEGYINAPV